MVRKSLLAALLWWRVRHVPHRCIFHRYRVCWTLTWRCASWQRMPERRMLWRPHWRSMCMPEVGRLCRIAHRRSMSHPAAFRLTASRRRTMNTYAIVRFMWGQWRMVRKLLWQLDVMRRMR